MKKILFVILFIFSSLPVMAEDKSTHFEEYKTQIEQCDKNQTDYLHSGKELTNADMKESNYTRVKCYKKTVNDIIDNYYSKNATKLKESFDNFIKVTFELEGDIYLSNNKCPENCGTMLFILYTDSAANQIKTIALEFIKALKIVEF